MGATPMEEFKILEHLPKVTTIQNHHEIWHELVMQDFHQKAVSNLKGKITQTPFDFKAKNLMRYALHTNIIVIGAVNIGRYQVTLHA